MMQMTASHHAAPPNPAYVEALKGCREALHEFIDDANCAPILLRTAWHDAGTYDPRRAPADAWPAHGGANGSIRFDNELAHGANAGLPKGIKFLQPFKTRFPMISWADLIQLAGATSIEAVGGPRMPMRYGRVDTQTALQCPPEGNLPGAAAPFPNNEPDAATHLRTVFYRMGFDDQEIVALSGAHTIGRAFKERSGTVDNGYGEAGATKFTCPMASARADAKPGVGMAGGKSWTSNWLTFDNTYFQKQYATEPELLWLDTDKALHTDARFGPYFRLYAQDQRAFFRDFSAAFVKLSECGSKFEPADGIRIDCPHMLRAKLEAVAVQPKPVLDKANSFGGRTALEREAPPSPSGGPSTQQLSLAEVAKHKTAKDAWIVLHGKVYDVTGFLSSHPGGKMILLKHCGKDATEEFEMIHPPNTLKSMAKRIVLLGDVQR